MKHLGVNIEVKAEDKLIAGTTEWLKKQIETSEFRFGSTKDDEPCVIMDFYKKNKEGVRIKTNSTIVAFIDSGTSDAFFYRDYTEECKISFTHAFNDETPCLFNYLTKNAAYHCDLLIKKLANELINKVKSDKQNLTINVEVK